MQNATIVSNVPMPDEIVTSKNEEKQVVAAPVQESVRIDSIDLNAPGVAAKLAARVKTDIDKYCEIEYDGGHRTHLGASLIGRECSRYLWYVFRWCYHKKHDGRMQRLFNRGHREEERFTEWLRGIGCEVWTHDTSQQPNDKGEFPQFRVTGVGGHFGGSLDAIIKFPLDWKIGSPVLGEFKTNGTGAAFNALDLEGMPRAKPDHFAQTSVYGYKYGFTHVCYLNINKNDDSLHVGIVKLDWELGKQMEAKAEKIIMSEMPPARLSNNPTFKTCAYCDMKGVCHEGKPVEKNCRSCRFAQPIDNAEWHCHYFNGTIPKDFIRTGCDNHQSANVNV